MTDYISREAAKKAIEDYAIFLKREFHESFNLCGTFDAIDKVPAADVKPVVRCKDCKHRIVNEHYGEKGYLHIKAACDLDTNDVFELGRNAEDDDWYCADGERRTE